MTSDEKIIVTADFQPSGENSEGFDRAGRVRQVIKDVGGRNKLAELTGIPANTLATYSKGVEMKLTNAVRIADACNVTVEWLATGRPPQRRPGPNESVELEKVSSFSEGPHLQAPHRDEISKYSVLPAFNVNSSGHLAYKSRQIVEHFAFDTSWLIGSLKVSPDTVFLMEVWDTDMEPEFFLGDTVLIDTSWRRTQTGGVYAFAEGERIMLRRLIGKSGSGMYLAVESEGSSATVPVDLGLEFPLTLKDKKTLYLGRVVWHSRSLKNF